MMNQLALHPERGLSTSSGRTMQYSLISFASVKAAAAAVNHAVDHHSWLQVNSEVINLVGDQCQHIKCDNELCVNTFVSERSSN